MSSKTVYLSPSTQEKNIGVGDYGTEEFRCNLIADVTQQILSNHGVSVIRNKPSMTLSQVVADSNSYDINLHQAIHTNAYNEKARGCETFCYKLSSTDGYKLAQCVYKYVSAITPTEDRGIKQAYDFYGTGSHMYEPVYTKAVANLVEVAFHDNVDDAKWIIENISNIGVAIAKGDLEYLGIAYVDNTEINIAETLEALQISLDKQATRIKVIENKLLKVKGIL